MNSLKELIGQEVGVNISIEDDECGTAFVTVRSKVHDVYIDDFHFEEKWMEPINIKVVVEPIGELPDGITYDHFEDNCLDQIVR